MLSVPIGTFRGHEGEKQREAEMKYQGSLMDEGNVLYFDCGQATQAYIFSNAPKHLLKMGSLDCMFL